MEKISKKQIILCTTCKGDGFLEKSDLIDYHKRDYKITVKFCSSCNGSGRIIEEVTVIRSPFVSNKKEEEYFT